MRTLEGIWQESERRYGELWDERMRRFSLADAEDEYLDDLAMERWVDDGGHCE